MPKEDTKKPKKVTVLTYGNFDALHWGHINLLQRAKNLGDRLVVAVSTDEFSRGKNKETLYSYEERVALLKQTKLADIIIPENNWEQKVDDVKKYDVDIFVMGEDWKGKFNELKCKIIYLPRTEGISTSDIKERVLVKASTNIRLG
jgi:glycerol-3-phosphate cytidylyltransferase